MLGLSSGETATVEVQPGSHEVVAKMGWTRSPALGVTCRDGEATRVEVVVPRPFLAGLRTIFSPGKVFEVRRV